MSTVVLDDRDSSIAYRGNTWNPSGNPAAEYLGTSMGTSPAPGTSATVTFTGTGITVFGTLDPGIQMSTFSVDGAPPTTFTSTNASSIRYAQAFYTSKAGTFPLGVHTLVMTPIQANFWLDFLNVNDPPVLTPSTSSTELATSTTTGAQAQPTVNSSVTSNGSVQNQKNTPVGPIVGAALGGSAVLFILFLICLRWVLWRRQEQENPGGERSEAKHSSGISPFTVPFADTRPISDFGYLPATRQSDTAQNEFVCRGGNRRLGPESHESTLTTSTSSQEAPPPPRYPSVLNLTRG
ncbi:hypothetical protein BDN70DRAFT_925424 [Pholiota conissans]|uniref:Transmembrane protein n=1 Tax=Pholiota conissans TaxID=109636 RepID=A0A9P5YSL6_9AGAR|nr:hypothetical protein BDN70DRAFT_925424 [Pholiota conissans]